MYFETPISDWSQVVVALFAATALVPTLAYGLVKLVVMVENKKENKT